MAVAKKVATKGPKRGAYFKVEGAKVTGEILALTKAAKLTVFKMKKRKGYRVRRGHRQQYTH